MSTNNNHLLGHTLLRVTVGLLFLIMGYRKIIAPEGIIGMLGGLGFSAATLVGWVLILSELIFGALILVGYKVRYTAWPIAGILLVALVLVIIPTDGISSSNSFFHLIGIAAMVTIALSGPGKYAISEVR